MSIVSVKSIAGNTTYPIQTDPRSNNSLAVPRDPIKTYQQLSTIEMIRHAKHKKLRLVGSFFSGKPDNRPHSGKIICGAKSYKKRIDLKQSRIQMRIKLR
jgi:hypothetical protein